MSDVAVPCPLCRVPFDPMSVRLDCPCCGTGETEHPALIMACGECAYGPYFLPCPSCGGAWSMFELFGAPTDSVGEPLPFLRPLRLPDRFETCLSEADLTLEGELSADDVRARAADMLTARFSLPFPLVSGRIINLHDDSTGRTWLHARAYSKPAEKQSVSSAFAQISICREGSSAARVALVEVQQVPPLPQEERIRTGVWTIGDFLSRGEVYVETELTDRRDRPLTMERAGRLLSALARSAVVSDRPLASLRVTAGLEVLPEPSFIEVGLYSETLDAIGLVQAWPEPVGTLRIELPGPRAMPTLNATGGLRPVPLGSGVAPEPLTSPPPVHLRVVDDEPMSPTAATVPGGGQEAQDMYEQTLKQTEREALARDGDRKALEQGTQTATAALGPVRKLLIQEGADWGQLGVPAADRPADCDRSGFGRAVAQVEARSAEAKAFEGAVALRQSWSSWVERGTSHAGYSEWLARAKNGRPSIDADLVSGEPGRVAGAVRRINALVAELETLRGKHRSEITAAERRLRDLKGSLGNARDSFSRARGNRGEALGVGKIFGLGFSWAFAGLLAGGFFGCVASFSEDVTLDQGCTGGAIGGPVMAIVVLLLYVLAVGADHSGKVGSARRDVGDCEADVAMAEGALNTLRAQAGEMGA